MASVPAPAPNLYSPPNPIRRVIGPVVRYIVLALFAALTLYPLLLVVSTAIKNPADFTVDPFALFSSVRLENISDAWTVGEFGRYFWNTVVITMPTVLGVVALSTMAGYALARLEFPGRNLILYAFMLGLMIPFTSVMIPLFYQLRDMGLLGSLLAVILAGIGGAAGYGVPLGVFLMRAFFQDLPHELAEAARVDGASEWQVFRKVMLPLAGPGIAVLSILVFFQSWNQFLMPFLFVPGQENRPLASGLYLFATGRTQDYQLIAAGSLIMIVPVLIVFILFQRQFVKGVTAGALKG
ncbi:MAG TPA: carbohydrate ABC transporter permease [Actinomycetota bacterium]|nr:carbohydrate ABC transporter permease [Actinomycetota bacterium]